MNIVFALPLIIVGVLQLTLIVIFLYRLKYVKEYGLVAWGTFLTVSPAFTGLATMTSYFLFPKIPPQSIIVFFSNILLIVEMGIILLTYHHFKKISIQLLKTIFFTFFIFWVIEFTLKSSPNNVSELNNATVLLRVIVVILVWLYFFDLYSKSFKNYKSIPFFWIALGWLIYYAVTSAAYTPDIESQKEQTGKLIMFYIYSCLSIISSILYGIGFWNTKDWVLQKKAII